MLSKIVYSSNVFLKRSFTMFRLPYSYLRRISPTIERRGLKGLRGQNGHKFLLPRSRRLRHWRSSIPLRRSSSSSSPSSSAAASRESCSLPSPPPFSNTDTVVARSPPPRLHATRPSAARNGRVIRALDSFDLPMAGIEPPPTPTNDRHDRARKPGCKSKP